MQEVGAAEIVTEDVVFYETLKSCVCWGIADQKTSRLGSFLPSLGR